jgi:K(+)-stimulated pyrophosphate-energized sodium pump
MESSVYSVIAIALAIGAALWMGDGNLQYSLYLVSLTGIGMLCITGIVVSADTFGPVSDNAAGIAEMAGEFDGEAQKIMVSLDAVGNTTKAVTKGFAIGSAVVAAVALFASYIETIGDQLRLGVSGPELFHDPLTQINVADPKVFIGALIGGSVAFLFSALTIRAVGRSASVVVQEVRRQFREHPGIMTYQERPQYTALGAFLATGIVSAALMAYFLSNSGGAWDNAKKAIEDREGGKGSEMHKAAVIGDTVGDPFKDTSGPALNPLVKVMNLVSLLLLPAVISLRDNDAARIAITAAALVVLIGAIAYSKRATSLVDAD